MTHGHTTITALPEHIEQVGEPYELYTYHDGHDTELLEDVATLPQFLADIEFACHLYRFRHLQGVEDFYDDPVFRTLQQSGGSGGVWCLLMSGDVGESISQYLDLDRLVETYMGFAFFEWGTQGVARMLTRRRPSRWFPVCEQDRIYPGASVRFEMMRYDSGARFDTCIRPNKSLLEQSLDDPEDEYSMELMEIWNRTIIEHGLPHYAAQDDGFPWVRLEAGHIAGIHGHLKTIADLVGMPPER